MMFELKQESIAGGPEINFEFEGSVGRATLAGAKLIVEVVDDDRANMTIVDASGECLADVMVRKVSSDVNLTVTVARIGSALLWSHARWVEAKSNG